MREYKLKKEIEDVFRYAIAENEIYIVGKNNFRVLWNYNLVFSTETEDTFQDVHESLKYCLLPYTSFNKTGIYSKSNNEFHIVEGVIGVALDENSNSFFGNKINEFCKYNFAVNKEVWSLESRLFNFYQNENSIFGMLQGDKSKLYSFAKETGQTNWEFDFSEIGALSFSLIIGIKNGVLFVPVKIDRNEGQIVGLDIKSGELVFQSSKELEGDKVDFDKLPIIYNWSFISNNTIIGIRDYWIYTVNILTSKITLFNKKEYLANNDIREINSGYKISENEQNLFLIGHQKMKYNIEDFRPIGFIIALNRVTLNIEWKLPVGNSTEAPKLIGEKLCQRISDDKLLIFEKANS